MRKGRLELWLGTACVGLVLAVGLVGLYHRHIQALYYRWQFLCGEKTAAAEPLRRLAALGPAGRRHLADLVLKDPANDLTALSRHGQKVTVRNDRRHRVYVGDPSWDCWAVSGWSPQENRDGCARAVAWLMQRSDGSRTISRLDQRADGSDSMTDAVQVALRWLATHTEPEVLDPGETAEFWVGPAR